ncbi:GNAT family N-acetyltransferase [Thetidibacter halocola]|uniref:GNAT family N-acetyltransferase n=1 Tax=Thetidibacter halocola TaxID=2827239 RepID=A0A8J7WEN5_9RHOB|nr:GNAT family N-acetyltransferase [Thetidibacter halocola]MBS0126232.1 GNAT family N-acetyltransferase [Thetidibacter halocola]
MVEIATVSGPDVQVDALLERHAALMRSLSPAESCHVMTAEALAASGATVHALRDAAGTVMAVGALKPLGDGGVELKSMHTAAETRGRGLGQTLLAHLLRAARQSGATDAWLETGSAPEFAPARTLYERAGFAYCPPFGDYAEDPLSVFMHRRLAEPAESRQTAGHAAP